MIESEPQKGMTSINNHPKTCVCVVDDHPLVRNGLAQIINQQSDMVCGAEASDPMEALKIFSTHRPAVVLLDLRLKNYDGLEFIKSLKSLHSEVRILVLSQFDEELYAERALRAGAHGYIMKDHATEEVLDAIRTVRAGDLYLTRSMTNRLLQKSLNSRLPRSNDVEKLTDRELHVLQLLGTGLSTREISKQLKLSVKTIETYREHLKHKLDLDSAAALVQYATQWVQKQSPPVATDTSDRKNDDNSLQESLPLKENP
jgi:DNA-binding NarL/FixJ family response regulator